jgi:hypothetical protein
MCPQLPRLSPEYSHKAGLQTVITGMLLQMRPVAHSNRAGPVTMGRIVRGPPNWTRPHGGRTSSQAFVWRRIERRVSVPVLSSSGRRHRRGLRAEGGGYAFAPTTPKTHFSGLSFHRHHLKLLKTSCKSLMKFSEFSVLITTSST